MPDEKEIPEQETLDAGNEAETDADHEAQDDVGSEGEDAPESDGDQSAEEVEVAAPLSRGEKRFQKLSNEAKEAREEAASARREIAELRASQRREAQQESPDQVAQRLALMTPEERLEYKLDQAERRNQQQMQAMAHQVQDQADRSAFNALCSRDDIAARYSDRVEAKLREIRGQGQNVNREALLDYLVGQDIRSKGGAARSKQRKDGERRIARQTTQPGNSRGDSQPNKRGEQSAEERLANVTF